MRITKNFEDVTQTAIKAEEPDLAAIRKYALREVDPKEIWTGSMKLAHDRVDRTHERFTKAYLQRFADTLPGKSVLPGHDYSQLPLGRFYSGSVVPDAEGHHLKVSYYLPSDSPLVPQIELGILKDVSIGFNAGTRTCDLCEKSWDYTHEHMPGMEYDGKTCTLTYAESDAHKAEAMEGSFVWCGAQIGAEAVAMAMKAAGFEFPPSTINHQPSTVRGANKMTIEQATAEIERLKALPLAEAREAELQKALSEKEPLAKDGSAYRAFIKAEILRMAGAIDEHLKTSAKTDQQKAILAHMEHAPAETLLAVLEGVKADFNAVFSQGSGATGGTEGENQGKTRTTPYGRRAFGGLF